MNLLKSGLSIAVVLTLLWFVAPRPGDFVAANAADKAAATPLPLQVVSYNSGLTGFFEPSSKTLYVYASDLKTPFMTVQVETLGEPLKVIKEPKQ
ncbi:MAG: hypothetical protein L0228_04785 [Planctomycetes bacterium]|nr:hypothetical protein [Planctomycetota bacterium]